MLDAYRGCPKKPPWVISIGVVLSPGVVSCGGTLEKGGIFGHTRYSIQAHLFDFLTFRFFGRFSSQVVLGDLLVGGLESAFRGYFPPYKYRSSDGR